MTGIRLDYQDRLRRIERRRRLAVAALILALGLLAALGGWWAGRRVNYALLYEDMVRATVRELVKPEALKERP